ncbi:TIGR04255 family protein [Rhizobium mongolense]|uniref:TIGR04255 family protein n=1 Tax=Rhizobium mongolense TaxID=57676 RepID=UPI003556F2B7
MNFPEAIRVIYEKNPLADVVCQLRFPRVLAIDERLPVDFQSAIATDFPFVESQEIAQLSFGPGDPISNKRLNYVFTTEDKRYAIALNSESLAISTKAYTEWADFSNFVRQALEALLQNYSVSLFQRIGLRYINVISKKKLGLEDRLWSDLVRRSALGLLAEDDVPIKDVIEMNYATAFRLDVGKTVMRTVLGTTEQTGDELVLVLDNDFFYDEPIRGAENVIATCGKFNNIAGRAFRWIVLDALHEKLEPKKPGEVVT